MVNTLGQGLGERENLGWMATSSLLLSPKICSCLSHSLLFLPPEQLPIRPSPPTLCLMCLFAQPRPAHHLSVFLTHVKAHEQGPYNHHHNKDHHHNHDEKAFEMHRAAGDAELAPGTC